LTIPFREPNKNINNHISEKQEIWKRNLNQCSLSLQAQHRKSDWYFLIGCSKNMAGEKNGFLTLKKERDGSVSSVNNHSAKIISRGTINIGRKKSMEQNVLMVEYMKHNLLSVSQMCD
jgi:hypothetical protein